MRLNMRITTNLKPHARKKKIIGQNYISNISLAASSAISFSAFAEEAAKRNIRYIMLAYNFLFFLA